jgi:hypothetical protein
MRRITVLVLVWLTAKARRAQKLQSVVRHEGSPLNICIGRNSEPERVSNKLVCFLVPAVTRSVLDITFWHCWSLKCIEVIFNNAVCTAQRMLAVDYTTYRVFAVSSNISNKSCVVLVCLTTPLGCGAVMFHFKGTTLAFARGTKEGQLQLNDHPWRSRCSNRALPLARQFKVGCTESYGMKCWYNFYTH